MSHKRQLCMNVKFTNTKDSKAEDYRGDWISNSRSTLAFAVALVAALSFKLRAYPPGGFDKAGVAIMKDREHKRFVCFTVSCGLCFYSSALLVFLLLTGASVKSRVFKVVCVLCMGSLVFLFHVSQIEGDDLLWAFDYVAAVFNGGLFHVLK